MIPYASCLCFGSRARRQRAWKLLAAQEGTTVSIGNDEPYFKDADGDESRHNLTGSEICMLEAVKMDSRLPVPLGEQEAIAVGRRSRQPVITDILDLSLLDNTYDGVTKVLLSRCNNWAFNTFNLDVSTGGRSLSYLLVHLFQEYGFVKHFNLDIVKVWHCFNLMESAYHRHNPYHNSVHAADVTQAMHCFLQENKFSSHLTPLEAMASVIAAVAHDLDHPGVTQAFLVATSNHLVNLYHNSSVLENHHWRTAISCLRESGIFDHLERDIWNNLQEQIRSLILATDITRQKEFLARFKGYLTSNCLNMKDAEYRHFALQIALKCADLCNPCRPWAISQRWSYQVCQEFYRQGAYEKQLKLPPTPTFDCSKTKVAKIQADFFQFVVSPLFETWDHFLKTPLSNILLKNLQHNFCQWQQRIVVPQIEEVDLVDKEIPDIKVDSSSISSITLIDNEKGPEGMQYLVPDSDVVLKQHRSKSDSGLVPPLLSSKLHMETYSTEELHPSTTLLSLSSITNTVQLRQVYATTKVESHLICPTVFQPLSSTLFTKDSSTTNANSLLSIDCDEELCSNILNNISDQNNTNQSAENSPCLDGCGTPPNIEDLQYFPSYNKNQRSKSLVTSTDQLKLEHVHRRASDYCVNFNLHKNSLTGEKIISNNSNVTPGIGNQSCISDNISCSISDNHEKDKKKSSTNDSNNENIINFYDSHKETNKITPSWGWHISRSFSSERPARYTYEFATPVPSSQGSSTSIYRLNARRGSAPVTFSHSENITANYNSEGSESMEKSKDTTEEINASGRRWSVPFEVSDFSESNNSAKHFEKNVSPKMFDRRSSVGMLEPLLTMSEKENNMQQTSLKTFHQSCHIISSHEKNDELKNYRDKKILFSDSFLPSLPSTQVSVQRRGSLPTDLYQSKERNPLEELTLNSNQHNFLLENARKNGSPGDLLSVLIGPSGMFNAMHGIVSSQTICGLPHTVTNENLRRKSGGLELISGLWKSRTNEIGVGTTNKLNQRRQLHEAWTLYRNEQSSPISPNSNISSLNQHFVHPQRRGSVPLSVSFSLNSGK